MALARRGLKSLGNRIFRGRAAGGWSPYVFLAAAACLLAAPTALAARAPALLSVGQSSGHLTASWSLPPGVQTDQLVAGTNATPDPFFGLASAEYAWWADSGDLSRTQTSFTSPDPFDPGTYYVRVGGIDTADQADTQWSNILSVVVPRPPKPPPPRLRTGRYKGRTEFPDSRPISFTLSRNRRQVRQLKVRFRLDCQRGAFPVGQFLARLTFKPIPVRKGFRFKRTGRSRFREGGRISVSVKGTFRPPDRARGTLTARARLPGGVKCSYFPIRRPKWSARHK